VEKIDELKKNERIVGILKQGHAKDLSPEIRKQYGISKEGYYKKCVCEYDNAPREVKYKESLGRVLDFTKSLKEAEERSNNLKLSEFCILFERTKERKSEEKTMEWLNKMVLAIPNTNLTAIKELLICMDKFSPNYGALEEKEKLMVEELKKKKKVVNIVLVTLFKWFGSSVGLYCLKQLIAEGK